MFEIPGEDLLNTALSWGLDTMSSKWTGDQNYEYQRRLQEHDFAFQREMWDKQLEADNTAIQRRMADADKAGLNANLLFNNGGSGASTPSVSGGSTGANVGMQKPDIGTAIQMSMQKERQDAEIQALKDQTGADVELKSAQAVLALKQAGLTDQEINFFMTHGVPAGTTISGNVAGILGTTVPVGYNNPHGKKPKNIATTAYNDVKKFIKKFQEKQKKKE